MEYFALILLIFVGLTLFYGIIAIHDIPYEIAKRRNHPQQDAIHVAGWISLFTLHALWPLLWIWATLYRPDRGWGFIQDDNNKEFLQKLLAEIEGQGLKIKQLESVQREVAQLQSQLAEMQKTINVLQAEAGANQNNNNQGDS